MTNWTDPQRLAEEAPEVGGGQERAAPGRVPDFFIVGHPKSGTTALFEILRAHPQIYMPELKEPTFFASEIPREAHRTTLPATLAEYLALFADAQSGQRAGEASATYLWSPSAPGRIAALQPEARIIAILREPASFLRSLHLQNLQSHYETETDLRRALALEAARRQGIQVPPGCRRPQALLYSEYTRYVEQLRRYHAAFAREHVLSVIYDDFRADNEATVRAVLRHLGVGDGLPIPATEANPTVRVRSPRLDDMVHALSRGRGPVTGVAKAAVKALAPRAVRHGVIRAMRRRLVVTPPPAPDEDLMLELKARFKPEVIALSEYLDRDLLALWGYDPSA